MVLQFSVGIGQPDKSSDNCSTYGIGKASHKKANKKQGDNTTDDEMNHSTISLAVNDIQNNLLLSVLSILDIVKYFCEPAYTPCRHFEPPACRDKASGSSPKDRHHRVA